MIKWIIKNRQNLLETIIFGLCIGIFIWAFLSLIYMEALPK